MLTATFSSLLFALLAASTPLGDRSLASRQGAGNGVQVSRRFILASRVDAPPACVALAANATTTVPTADNSTLPLNPTSTSPSSNSSDPTSPTDAGSNTNTTIPLEIRPLSDSARPPSAPSSSSSGNGVHVSNALTFSRRRHGFGKRIAQADLPNIAQQWQDLCLSSGGPIFSSNFSANTTSPSSSNTTDPSDSSPCVTLAGFGGLDALLADADPCAQQDIADLMISFAKSSPLSTQASLIAFAIKYRQHPRNALNILGIVPSTPYCTRAPKSEELRGVVNRQLDGVDPGVFGGPKFALVPFGEEGTCPFGQTPDVETCTCLNSTSTDTSGNATPTVTVEGDASATPTVSATIAGDDTSVSGTALPPTPPAPSSSASDDTSDVDPTTDPSSDDDSSTPDDTSNPSPPATASSSSSSSDNSSNPSPPATASSSDGGNQPSQNTPKTSGPVFQPDDIDGDVNDPEGRRSLQRRGDVGARKHARGLRRL